MSANVHEKISQKAFKMKIILDLMALPPSERSAKINELSKIEFDIPYSNKKYLSRSTFYTWIKEYESAANRDYVLIRKEREDKGKWRTLTEEQKKALIRWRYENAYRTCEELREELIAVNLGLDEELASVSVIRRFLRAYSLDRKTMLLKNAPEKKKIRMSFEADYPNQLWMIDTKGPNIKIPSKEDPSNLVSAMPVVLLDDYARFITGVRYVRVGEEKEELIMELLMEAFDKFGIPNILYTDRGPQYMGKSLEKALSVVGCRVLHTQSRDCEAKGKVEHIMKLYYEKLDTELNTKKMSEKLSIEQVNEYAAAITLSYHMTIHRETNAKPYERYLNYPGKFRRYASKQIMSLLFLPVTKSKVSKDNLITLNKRHYLIPVTGYDKKFVEVRYRISEPEFVYIWYDNNFIGIAEEYISQNDYQKRQKYIHSHMPHMNVVIPDESEVPEYNRLERKLMEYRTAIESCENINAEIKKLNKQCAEIVSQYTLPAKEGKKDNSCTNKIDSSNTTNMPDSQNILQSNNSENNVSDCYLKLDDNIPKWTADNCIHLLSSLFRRSLSSQERYAVHRIFNQFGPLEEKMVRRVVGKLLGESHPTNDLNAYLDAIRIESMIGGESK